jgi:NRE family putative nickel resistance protein-like MFS transporter
MEATLGPLLAGVFIAAVGVQLTFWVDGLTYVVSAALVMAAHVPHIVAGSTSRPGILGDMTHGTRVLFREPALRQALLLHMVEAAAGAAVIVTTVVYVHEVLGRGDTAFALAMASVGLGSAVIALLLPRSAERLPGDTASVRHVGFHRWAERSLLAGGLLLSASLLPGMFTPGIVLLAVLWAINGAGQSLIAIPSVGLLAEHTRANERGRAYAAHFAWTHLFWLATYPAAGFLARAIGTPRAFTVVGAACVLLTLAAFAIRSPDHTVHLDPDAPLHA